MATLFSIASVILRQKEAMANEIQEYFLGQNEQEIEDERRRKRALIHYFPNSMGNTDQTKYILRKDGNQKQNESLGSNAIDEPGKVVISNESEKSQEQNWEQMPKVTDFVNRNIETPFASNGFTQAGSLSGFNNTGHTIRTNDSLKVPLNFTKHNIYALKHEENNYNLTLNRKTQGDRNKRSYYGTPTKNDYTEQIKELKQLLPKDISKILDNTNTKIGIVDNLYQIDEFGERHDTYGIYAPEGILLDSKHVNFETLFAETLHVLHNYLSLKPSPNLEFQEHVLKDIYFYYIGYPYSISTVFDNNGDFYNFIDQSFSNGQIDVNKFSKEIIRYIDDFQERYKSVPKYKSIDKNYYNYNWKIFFDILGIPNK